MSCRSDNNRRNNENNHNRNGQGRGRNCERVLVNSASFASYFTDKTTAKFFADFINGRCIDETKNNTSIQLTADRIYLVSYSYTLDMEKCGSFEIIPLLNGDKLRRESTTVCNCREGRVTASNSFVVKTCSCSILSFNFRADDCEIGKRPCGQVSIVDLGRANDIRENSREFDKSLSNDFYRFDNSGSSSSEKCTGWNEEERYWFEEQDSNRRGYDREGYGNEGYDCEGYGREGYDRRDADDKCHRD